MKMRSHSTQIFSAIRSVTSLFYIYVYTLYIYIYTSVLCLVAQSCPTLCHPMDCSPPGSSVHGILQARILEWVAMPSSGGSSQRRDQTQAFCTAGRFFYCLKHQGSPRILEWVACPFSRGACWPGNQPGSLLFLKFCSRVHWPGSPGGASGKEPASRETGYFMSRLPGNYRPLLRC